MPSIEAPLSPIDPEDERVVQLADLLQRIEDAAHFVVGLRGVGRERLHQPRGHPLLVGRQGVVGRNFLGPRRQLRVRRDHAQLELALIGLLAVLVPALVELPLELVHPLLRHVMRSVGGAGGVVDEERPVGRDRLLLEDVVDGFVRQRIVQRVVPFLALRNFHLHPAGCRDRGPAPTGSLPRR